MKLGPLEVRRALAAQPAPVARTWRELGASGTVITDGWLQPHEYNRDLQGDRALAVWKRMRRSDPAVREALFHTFAPILNASWQVEPGSDDPLDLEVAAVVEAALFEWTTQPWGQFLRQALDHLTYGFMLFETPMQVVEREVEFTLPDGTPRSVQGQWTVWRRFAQRLPTTIKRWFVEEGELVEVEQWAWDGQTFRMVRLPASSLLVFVNEQEGDDFTGVSLLRTAFKPWWLKEIVEKVAGVAVERHGVGINTAYLPDRYRDDSAMLARVEQMMRDVRSGEFSYLVFPGPKASADVSGRDGFTFEINAPPGTLPDLVGFLEYLRGDIKGNVLARFAELGHGRTGARATSDTQSEVWYDSLHTVARYVCDVINEAVKRLVDLNYQQVSRYPKLVVEDIESRNLEEFANTHSKLVLAGAINPDGS